MALTVLAWGLSACGSLDPVTAPDLCDHGCSRDQFYGVLEFWEREENAIRFYGWLKTLGNEQLGWIREDGSNPLSTRGNSLAPGDHLRRSIVLFDNPDNWGDLDTAGTLVDYYLGNAVPDTDEYSFALLLQTAISDSVKERETLDQQRLALEEMESQAGDERAARQTLEYQLERLKQIEESLLGSNEL
jgi:hypothetical protein